MTTTAILLGLALSASTGLGYAKDGMGVAGLIEHNRARLESHALMIEKQDGGEGWAIGGNAMLKLAQLKAVSLWAGADGSYQSVSSYSSQAVAPRVEVQLGRGKTKISAYWVGEAQKIQSVIGIKARAGSRAQFVGSIEHVQHSQGDGNRVLIYLLWKVR